LKDIAIKYARTCTGLLERYLILEAYIILYKNIKNVITINVITI